MMRIAFVADKDEPGQSGVGDYALLLAGKLRSLGDAAEVFPLGDSGSERRGELPGQISAWRPDWVSFQFVPYAFAHRGLVNLRTLPWEKLRGIRGTHFMFHEIWIGSHRGASLRDRFTGLLQRRGIRSVMRALQPAVVHCSNRLYSSLLSHAGIPNRILPLFGNIPLLPGKEDPYAALIASIDAGGDRARWMVAAFFGTIHRDSSALKVLRWLQGMAQRQGRRVLVVSLGRCPDAAEDFRQWAEALDAGDRLRFRVLGEMPPEALSSWLGAADLGISTTPYNIIEKSGSAVALAEHGVPVMVTDRGSPARHGDAPQSDLAPRFWLAEDGTLNKLHELPPRRPARSLADDVAETFRSQLEMP